VRYLNRAVMGFPSGRNANRWPLVLALLVIGWGGADHARASCGREGIILIEIEREIRLRDDGVWRCIEIPGFLVFSRLPDEQLAAFADELGSHVSSISMLRAPTNVFRPGATQMPVVLRQQPFPQLGSVPERSVLLQPFIDEFSLVYLAYTPGVVIAPNASARDSGPMGAIFGTPPIVGDRSRQPNPPQMSLAPSISAEMLARDHLARSLQRSSPTPPEWLARGVARLSRDLRFKGGSAALSECVPMQESAGRAVAVRELLTRPFPALDDRGFAASVLQARVFIHWGIAVDEARRARFWQFARRASDGPVDEALFQSTFGLSFLQMDVELSDMILANDGLLPAVPLEGGGRAGRGSGALVREPHPDEINGLLQTIERLRREPRSHVDPIL
jgi:hypothetical protein